MNESEASSSAARASEPQQLSSASPGAANESQLCSASPAREPRSNAGRKYPINLTDDSESSEPVCDIRGVDTGGIDRRQWQPNTRGQAFYWRFFWKAVVGGGKKALCLLCNKDVSSSSPSNLLHHLNQHHAKHPAYAKAKAGNKKEKEASAKNAGGAMLNFVKKGLSLNERNEFILQYVVKDLQALSTTESPNFRAMQCGLTGKPNFQCPGVKTLVECLAEKVREVHDIVVEKLRGQSVALTGDGWESRTGQSFYSLTSHVWDPDSDDIVRYTLACRAMDDRHTAINIAKLNMELLKEFRVEPNNITVFTSDTAANQKKAVHLMGVPWIGCACHVYELSSAVVSRHAPVAEAINAAKRVVAFVHKSPAAARELAVAQRVWDLRPGKLARHVETRWWSVTTLLESVFKNREPIKLMCQRIQVADSKTNLTDLTSHQYTIIGHLLTILVPMRTLQQTIEGEKYVSISHVDLSVSHLLQVLTSAKTSKAVCSEVQLAAGSMLDDIIVRWFPGEEILGVKSKKTIEEPLRFARMAAALDPRTKQLPHVKASERTAMYWEPIQHELIQMAAAQAELDCMQEDHAMRSGGAPFSDEEEDGENDLLADMIRTAKKSRECQSHSSGSSSDEDGEGGEMGGSDEEGSSGGGQGHTGGIGGAGAGDEAGSGQEGGGHGAGSGERGGGEGEEGGSGGGGEGKYGGSNPRRKRRKVKRSGELYGSDKLESLYLGELLRYRSLDAISCKAINKLGGPLKWWKQKEEMYPTLARMARKYLAVQATSAASERLFSVAGNTLTEKRSSLTDEHAENIIFLHSNRHLW